MTIAYKSSYRDRDFVLTEKAIDSISRQYGKPMELRLQDLAAYMVPEKTYNGFIRWIHSHLA
jgi:hypothetical protein